MDTQENKQRIVEPQILRRGIVVAGLLFFFLLALEAATTTSPTADEGMHMLRGQVLWQTGELDLQGQHTPLSHWFIGSLFWLELSTPDPTELPSWSNRAADQLVQEFIWQSGLVVDRLLLLGRLPMIFTGLLFGAFLARWSRRHFGQLGMIITVVLFAFSPNFLASAALATTDLLAAVTFTLAILALRHYWQKPAKLRWLLAGLGLGLGLSAKLTGILLVPLFLLISIAYKKNTPWWKAALIWFSWLPLAGIVVWAVYGFEVRIGEAAPFPIPAATYLENFIEVQDHIDRGHFAYLFGQRSNQGWYGYFLATFLLKTPLAALILTGVTVVYLIRSGGWKRYLYLWLPVLALIVSASISRLNIGYRHILPVLPLLWLMIAATAPYWQKRRLRRRILYGALALYAVLAVRQSPHFLSYFNELVGGSAQGYRYLGDSNVDWGQDLPALAHYVQGSEQEPMFISYFGPSDPSYYDLAIDPMVSPEGQPVGFHPANPESGRYLISVNHWQGTTEIEPDLFDWFRDQEAADRIGYSILVFDVDDSTTGDWIAHCTDPEPLLDEPYAAQLVGEESIRQLYFDCRGSWVLAEDGRTAGWFVLPPDLAVNDLPFGDELSLVYTNQSSPRYPAHAIYYWNGVNSASKILSETASLPQVDGQILPPPTVVDDLAQFIGASFNEARWASIWQLQQPTDLPLSIMIHLHGGELDPLVGDGLGFQPVQWQAGDILFQFIDGAGAMHHSLETGLYNYSSGESVPFTIEGERLNSVTVPRPD